MNNFRLKYTFAGGTIACIIIFKSYLLKTEYWSSQNIYFSTRILILFKTLRLHIFIFKEQNRLVFKKHINIYLYISATTCVAKREATRTNTCFPRASRTLFSTQRHLCVKTQTTYLAVSSLQSRHR